MNRYILEFCFILLTMEVLPGSIQLGAWSCEVLALLSVNLRICGEEIWSEGEKGDS